MILLDIEGTTTPISFVTEVLFPFARSRLAAAAASAQGHAEIAEALAMLREEWQAEGSGPPEFGDGACYARHLMDLDRKSTGLKRLQGLIWRDGYRSGELQGLVFDDVPPALAGWKERGLRLGVFSSGSVLAQKLLFGHTQHGDLNGFFEAYFDTTSGPKREAASYRAIASSFALEPAEILFLSDVLGELDAARGAGLGTGLLERPGNPPVDAHTHPVYASFEPLRA